MIHSLSDSLILLKESQYQFPNTAFFSTRSSCAPFRKQAPQFVLPDPFARTERTDLSAAIPFLFLPQSRLQKEFASLSFLPFIVKYQMRHFFASVTRYLSFASESTLSQLTYSCQVLIALFFLFFAVPFQKPHTRIPCSTTAAYQSRSKP